MTDFNYRMTSKWHNQDINGVLDGSGSEQEFALNNILCKCLSNIGLILLSTSPSPMHNFKADVTYSSKSDIQLTMRKAVSTPTFCRVCPFALLMLLARASLIGNWRLFIKKG